jgi:hypothetical protein
MKLKRGRSQFKKKLICWVTLALLLILNPLTTLLLPTISLVIYLEEMRLLKHNLPVEEETFWVIMVQISLEVLKLHPRTQRRVQLSTVSMG